MAIHEIKKMKFTLVVCHVFGEMDFKWGPLLRFLFLWDMMPHHRIINLLKMKRRPLYLKTQFVPHSKHFLSQL